MNPSTAGALIGLLGGIGLLLLVHHRRARTITLDDRLAPYLRVASSTSGLLEPGVRSASVLTTLERLARPWMADGLRLVGRIGVSTPQLRSRLERAGRTETVEQFRAGQVVSGSIGIAAGLFVALAAVVGRGAHPVAALVFVALGGIAGVVVPERLLSRQARARETRLMAELPTIAELLALAVGAGEGALGALERAARTTRGELAEEIARTLADTRAGTPLTVALERLADRTALVPLTRFAEGIAVALERGTPLAEVLRAQAQDVREAGRRALMETGGRKEVAMMVPVVFLVLPVTVVFAVFPSLAVLTVGL